MGNEKITSDMNIMDMILIMSEGNPGAIGVLMSMIKDPRGLLDILLCDSLEIRGSKLYMLYNDCCQKNDGKFKRTLQMLRGGIFTKEEIHANLNLVYAIPFIDDNIEIEGIPSYDEEFELMDDKWDEYCALNKESFTKRLNEKTKKNNKFESAIDVILEDKEVINVNYDKTPEYEELFKDSNKPQINSESLYSKGLGVSELGELIHINTINKKKMK